MYFFERIFFIIFSPVLLFTIIYAELKRVLKGTIIIKRFKKDFKFYWENPNKIFH